jgi:hypothetical protein
MQSDRELLELAAKAAGISGEVEELWSGHSGIPDATKYYAVFDSERDEWFAPLTDDGDALRLAVKLGVTVGPEQPDVIGKSLCRVSWLSGSHSLGEFGGGDPYAATRRAIVRAAAEIGKGLA